MDNTRQPGQSGNKTPVEDRPGANSQERDVSDEEKIDLSDPGTDVEQQEYEIDVPAVNQVEEGRQQEELPQTEPSKRRKKSKYHGIVYQDRTTGDLWWAKSKSGPWERATLFTPDVRMDFIEGMGQTGRYSHPRPQGKDAHDQTSYHPNQMAWGPERCDRPDILFQYEKRDKPEEERNAQQNPGFLRHRGRIVLAPDPVPHRPVLDYPEIPLTLSSNTEGWLLEAICRLNDSIILQDLRDRMPLDRQTSDNRLSMKRSRYRWRSGSLSWNPREGREAIKGYLDKLIPEHLLKNNTTEGFRDLEDHEIEEMKAKNKGKYPERRRKKSHDQGTTEPPVEAGPSIKTKKRATKVKSRSRSRSPLISRRPDPQAYRRRTPTPEDEEKGKGKKVSQESDPEELHEHRAGTVEDLIDWRDESPQTHEELLIVHHALMRTRLQISHLTRAPTPHTDQHASYNDQWEVLRSHYFAHWAARGNDINEIQALLKWGPWTDGFPPEFLNYQEAHAPIDPSG